MALKRLLLLSGDFLYQRELFSKSLLYEIMAQVFCENLPKLTNKTYKVLFR